jgi:anti-sigma regulatory factor (Ser/Thr protein kinase)/predicted transcriptional regulator
LTIEHPYVVKYVDESFEMAERRTRSLEIEKFILRNVEQHPAAISRLVAKRFGISRQATSRHLHSMVGRGLLTETGSTRKKRYALKPLAEKAFKLAVTEGLAEDVVWRRSVEPLLADVAKNVLDICHYGTTEMINNVIDHSESKDVTVAVEYKATEIQILISDHGIGIFEKIQKALGLEDQREVILELVKGKLTTDPERHTGEGIFFTSRMFDEFSIRSGKLYFARFKGDDWLIETHDDYRKGTHIFMHIDPDSKLTASEVFDKYASEQDDYGFTRTHVPVELAQYEGEQLVSRSQAKRLLTRFDRFKEVFLDFKGVESIGPAFADEIFRVYKKEHPNISLVWVNANSSVAKVIRRALDAAERDSRQTKRYAGEDLGDLAALDKELEPKFRTYADKLRFQLEEAPNKINALENPAQAAKAKEASDELWRNYDRFKQAVDSGHMPNLITVVSTGTASEEVAELTASALPVTRDDFRILIDAYRDAGRVEPVHVEDIAKVKIVDSGKEQEKDGGKQ